MPSDELEKLMTKAQIKSAKARARAYLMDEYESHLRQVMNDVIHDYFRRNKPMLKKYLRAELEKQLKENAENLCKRAVRNAEIYVGDI